MDKECTNFLLLRIRTYVVTVTAYDSIKESWGALPSYIIVIVRLVFIICFCTKLSQGDYSRTKALLFIIEKRLLN